MLRTCLTPLFTVATLLTSAGAQEIVRDSLPGQRLSWELGVSRRRGHGPGTERPGAHRRAVSDRRTEVPWELYDVFYLRLDIPRDARTSVDADHPPVTTVRCAGPRIRASWYGPPSHSHTAPR